MREGGCHQPSDWGIILFSIALLSTTDSGFRRAPVQIKDPKKAIRFYSEEWWWGAGDTAQTIASGVGFRFEDLKSIFQATHFPTLDWSTLG
jgi:hypothetical protein